jgi:SAM-dependent methyltransferase
MRDRNAIIELNKRQKAYYESRFRAAGGAERAANRLTNLWTYLRRRIQANDERIGTREHKLADHKAWLGDLSDKDVLDLGCFSGNELTLWIAGRCRSYVGLDLSENAAAELQAKLESAVPDGRAIARAGDILQNDFADGSFDVIYAHSVLHHFEDITCVLEELRRLLRLGGMVVSVDPLATEPLNRTARALYRPFQTDAAWEWPFTLRTFRELRRYFVLDRVQGYRGFSMLSFPLALVPFLGPVARDVGRAGLHLERRFADRPGPALWICWVVSTRLVKPAGADAGAAGQRDEQEGGVAGR